MVNATTRSATNGSSFGIREGGVLSRRSPSTPSAANRSCQRQTQVLDLPVSRMIAFVPTPSALSKTICARQTCFCGALRSLITERSRSMSAEHGKEDASSHAAGSHAASPPGIPIGIQMSDAIHWRALLSARISAARIPERLCDETWQQRAATFMRSG